ncbi:MAG: hypothetical protein ACOY5F_11785 [Pseudomonadota bacterium]
MPRHRRTARRVSITLTLTHCCAVAIALLCTAPEALSQAAGQTTTAPESPFSRWFRFPSAAAAPAAAAPGATAAAQPVQRIRKPRIAKARKRARAVATVPQPVPAAEQPAPQPQERVEDSGWPNAEDNAGTAMITPLTVKTVREQLEPEAHTLLASENEPGAIDRAAQPLPAAMVSPAAPASTDGSGAIENETDRTQVFAMGESMKPIMQSAWTEPVLLMIAGALAGLAASRFFV